ncbi:hypothetical protein Sjap_019459 [Stephania japonica]|uniref:Protein arginine N-methyltransferase domain-containing protein n=1 Tax=Stephania japonica TaxID=461633 RepID=A0AAP0EYT6_9MAGN
MGKGKHHHNHNNNNKQSSSRTDDGNNINNINNSFYAQEVTDMSIEGEDLLETTESSNLCGSVSESDQIIIGSEKTSADYYFDSYSHFGIHEEMLKDTVRTKTYQNVIYQNTFLIKNKVVLDVGAGTGILSLFCAKAGAKHVYAISPKTSVANLLGHFIGIDRSSIAFFCKKLSLQVECSQMGDMAKEIVEANKLSHVITVLKGKVEDITLPVTHVDVIISEWMGYFLLFENMLDTVLYARDKWLVESGVVLPDRASLYLTAIEDADYKDDKVEFWKNVYGFDMSCIRKQTMMEPLVDTVDEHQIVTNTQLLKMAPGDVSFTAPFKLVAERNDYIHALVAYFDVSFSKCHKLIGFSTGPRSRATHWKQTVLYLEDVLTICKGEAIVGSMTVAPNKTNPRDVDIRLKYSLNGLHCQVSRTQHYKMR